MVIYLVFVENKRCTTAMHQIITKFIKGITFLVLLSSDIHEFPTPDSICRTPSIFFLLLFTLLPALIHMVIRPQLMPANRAGVVLVLNKTKNHGWLDTLIATMVLLHSKSTLLIWRVHKKFTSHGFRQGGWKRCLQGSSCILSSKTKFSRQTAHSVSLPNLAMTSSVTAMTGRLATTSFEAGGAFGGCSMIPWH